MNHVMAPIIFFVNSLYKREIYCEGQIIKRDTLSAYGVVAPRTPQNCANLKSLVWLTTPTNNWSEKHWTIKHEGFFGWRVSVPQWSMEYHFRYPILSASINLWGFIKKTISETPESAQFLKVVRESLMAAQFKGRAKKRCHKALSSEWSFPYTMHLPLTQYGQPCYTKWNNENTVKEKCRRNLKPQLRFSYWA